MKRDRILFALLLAWILFIFTRSLQPAQVSNEESGQVLSLLDKLFPSLTMYMVRKAGHITEFAILGLLAGLLLSHRCQTWGNALCFGLFLGLSVAVCDETIQLFVEGRSGQLSDVWIDFSGAAAGTLIVVLACRKRKGGTDLS